MEFLTDKNNRVGLLASRLLEMNAFTLVYCKKYPRVAVNLAVREFIVRILYTNSFDVAGLIVVNGPLLLSDGATSQHLSFTWETVIRATQSRETKTMRS